ncbi:MAG: YicC/YloC family endoribonuclease [Chlamydiota bacterium]
MTAFARSCQDTSFGRLVIEIQSLNRKMLDIHLFLPKELARFEIEIRKWISDSVYRGQLSVRIYLKSDEPLLTQLPQLQQLKLTWEKIATELGYDPTSTVTLSFLVQQLPFLVQNEDESKENQMKDLLKDGIEIVLKELTTMKEREGKALTTDVETRLKTLQEQLDQVEERSEFAVEKYKQKLTEKMQEYHQANDLVDDRLLREIAIFAEKINTSEEETRLKSHIEQFQHLLSTSEKSIGKTLDFLTQELNREVNTLASKSADAELSLLTVAMKSEIEKIREQIQNIE